MNAHRAHASAFLIALGLSMAACGPPQLFPTDALQEADRAFDFAKWKANPNADKGRKVELGGRIMQSEATENGVTILAMQLPIKERPVYGPVDSGRRTGEFAIFFPGPIEPSSLTPGNHFIVVGWTGGFRVVTVEGDQRGAPFLTAQCIHLWKTEGREIAEFPEVGAGYYPLEQDTYCSNQPQPDHP